MGAHESSRAWDGIDELVPFGPHDRVVLIARSESDGQAIGVAHIVTQIKWSHPSHENAPLRSTAPGYYARGRFFTHAETCGCSQAGTDPA